MLVLAASAAQAQPAPSGDAVQGQKIATQGAANGVPACASCHGANGEGSVAFPRLAGTGVDYLRAQIDAFADGSRKNPVMQPFAKNLSTADRASVVLYYSQLKPPATAAAPADPTPADAGAWLVARGRWNDNLPACAQCHGPNGRGVGSSFPPLAGLPAAYTSAQLQAWKAGDRPAGPLGLMQAVAAKLSDADIQAVSAHYAGLAAPVSSAPAGAAAGGKQ